MNQTQLEQLIHPNHIFNDIQETIDNELHEHVMKAVKGLRKWLDIEEWDAKNKRKAYIKSLDLYNLVLELFTSISMHCQKEMPFISVACMYSIPGMDKLNSIKTVGEIIATLEPVGFYEIVKYPSGTRTIQSLLSLNKGLQNRLDLYCYLPPMVEKPDVLEHNKSSGYKTINSDSLILGYKENHHDKWISLDVLNTLNRQQYELDMDFISRYHKPFDELNPDELLEKATEKEMSLDEYTEIYQQQLANHHQWLEQFEVLNKHLANKPIYFTHKVDKRGRIYSQGYHYNTQSDSYGKACISLRKKELITGEL